VSQSAFPRSKTVFVAMAALVVAAVIVIAVWRIGGDDAAEPLAVATQETTTILTPTPSPEETTSSPTPTPEPSVTASCEGPDTAFNEEGVEQDSLLPDCGVAAPVTEPEQQKSGLGLACGGSYPVILYKTTTSGAKTSICGKDASGVDFRFVTQPKGGEAVDLKGSYEGQLDAFVAKDGTTTYTVQAYDGTLIVSKDGKKDEQRSSDWISLDNEPDTD